MDSCDFLYTANTKEWRAMTFPLRITAQKVSNDGVFSGRNTGKYEPGKTSYFRTFRAVNLNGQAWLSMVRHGCQWSGMAVNGQAWLSASDYIIL